VVLLLFDIDGTLLKGAAQAHAEALRAALQAVYGIRSGEGLAGDRPGAAPDGREPAGDGRGPAGGARAPMQFAGRTDIEIARELALRSGCPEETFQERVAELQARSVLEYERREADLSPFVVPGIGPLLAELGRHGQARLSLLTGNLEGIARLKLERAGLGCHFPAGQGGFGSDSEHRNELRAHERIHTPESTRS
jgi:phosphoglycolate phosphatase